MLCLISHAMMPAFFVAIVGHRSSWTVWYDALSNTTTEFFGRFGKFSKISQFI